jgi:hypothetical protein
MIALGRHKNIKTQYTQHEMELSLWEAEIHKLFIEVVE